MYFRPARQTRNGTREKPKNGKCDKWWEHLVAFSADDLDRPRFLPSAFDTNRLSSYPLTLQMSPRPDKDVQPCTTEGVAVDGQPSVLIVDRSEETREVLQTVLERRGVRTLAAGRTAAGLDLARRHQPDLIVLDLELDDVAECTEELAGQTFLSAQGQTECLPHRHDISPVWSFWAICAAGATGCRRGNSCPSPIIMAR